MKPRRIQLSRKKGWRMPPNTVKVDRSTKWGNPFTADVYGPAAVALFEFATRSDGETARLYPEGCAVVRAQMSQVNELRGKNLACWCKLEEGGRYNPCHADVLLALANDMSMEEVQNENLRRSKGEAGQ